MRITKAELYDRYYSASRNLYLGDTEMPNHCHNRVTFYASPEHNDQIAKIKQMFLDENIFTQIIPEPDWANTPLMSKDVQGLVYDRGKVGELPMQPSNENGHARPFRTSARSKSTSAPPRWSNCSARRATS